MDSDGASLGAIEAGASVAAGVAGAGVAAPDEEQADTATAAPINARITVLRMAGRSLTSVRRTASRHGRRHLTVLPFLRGSSRDGWVDGESLGREAADVEQ
jgi:hypothetical protein